MPWNYQDQRNWKIIKKDFLINPFFCGNLSQKNLRFFQLNINSAFQFSVSWMRFLIYQFLTFLDGI